MPVYYFKAKDHNHRMVRGRVQASSKDEVEKKLMSRQLVLVSASSEQPATKISMRVLGSVSTGKLVVATRQLAFLINASVPIVQALDTVSNNTSDTALKNIFANLKNAVESGTAFSVALKKYPEAFDDIYVNLVKSGEEGGSLDVMLKQLAVYIEKSHHIKQKVRSAMMYPGFIAFVACAIVTGIIVFLVPKFEEIFSDAGQQLPALTQLIVDISHALREHFVLIGLSLAGLVFGFLVFIKTESGRRIWESFTTHLPGVGNLISKTFIARFTRTLSSLLFGGGNIVESVLVAGKASGSVFITEASKNIAESVQAGFSLAKSLSKEKVFPALIKNMLVVGEQTGNVDDVLLKIAEFYEEQVDAAVEGLLKMIEPVLIVGVALVIGFILIALYLPIFDMSGAIAGG